MSMVYFVVNILSLWQELGLKMNRFTRDMLYLFIKVIDDNQGRYTWMVLHLFFQADSIGNYMQISRFSGSVGRALEWGIEGLLVQDSLESFCCVLEQDSLSAA